MLSRCDTKTLVISWLKLSLCQFAASELRLVIKITEKYEIQRSQYKNFLIVLSKIYNVVKTV